MATLRRTRVSNLSGKGERRSGSLDRNLDARLRKKRVLNGLRSDAERDTGHLEQVVEGRVGFLKVPAAEERTVSDRIEGRNEGTFRKGAETHQKMHWGFLPVSLSASPTALCTAVSAVSEGDLT
jgi:hypothetical protein